MGRKKDTIRLYFTFEGHHYEVTGATQVEAEIKKHDKLLALRAGSMVYETSTTFAQWSKIVMETYKQNITEKRRRSYQAIVNNCLLPALGSMQLKHIKQVHCQNALVDYRKPDGSPYSEYNVKQAKYLMHFILEKAVENRILSYNPAVGLVLPEAIPPQERRSLTEFERDIFLDVCEASDKFLIFELMFHTGCRPDEACRVQGFDVLDIKGYKMLHIRGTKTPKADRIVPLPDVMYQKLRKLQPFEYAATSEKGKHFTADSSAFKRRLKALKRALHLRAGGKTYRNQVVAPYPFDMAFTSYWLRHTYCTNLQKAGVDLATASKLMGHSSIAITADIYTHIDTTAVVNAARVMFGTGSEPGHTGTL